MKFLTYYHSHWNTC